MPASVGSTRRPERSSSCWPRRCSRERIWRLTAGCVTPSWSAACEKLRRSTTAQNATSCFVSISTRYSDRQLYDRSVPETTRLEDTLVRGYRQLALETPARPRDTVLRALDILLSSLFLLLSLPISLAIGVLVLVTSGIPVLYRGERVGRGGRVFTMYKFRTLRRGAAARPTSRRGAGPTHAGGVHAGRPLAQGNSARRDPAVRERPARGHEP